MTRYLRNRHGEYLRALHFDATGRHSLWTPHRQDAIPFMSRAVALDALRAFCRDERVRVVRVGRP